MAELNRHYYDNFSVKEFAIENLVPKYFEEIDVSLRNVGMIGYTTELITNCTEDAFNASSVMFRESFPNRAELPESIYSHASIFQLQDVFARAAGCRFLLVLEEAAVLSNMIQQRQGSSIYNFFIDKNTTIYVKDMPYVLDYDIQLNIVKKNTDSGVNYIFTAQYIMDDYKNSISEITDPYVKLRRSSDGYLALEVWAHQCIRDIRDEVIISNSTINYPTIELSNFQGKLAGFDILYTDPSKKYAKNGPVQMTPLIIYSRPLKSPFCYYQLIDDDRLRITFSSKDLFFMPEFNSNLQIILYLTEGKDGNFDVYNGTDIKLVPNDEKYTYSSSYLAAAATIGSSKDGMDIKSLDDLQALTVEGYRTANALTTEHDLQQYFNNYKHRYGDQHILFIEKRNDVYERVFSAFLMIHKENYIYKTNTLNVRMNLYDMKTVEKNVFILEPGHLFTANDTNGYAYFYRSNTKNLEYYKAYQKAIEDGNANYLEDTEDTTNAPAYLKRPASFAEWKSRNGIDDKLTIFDLTEEDLAKLDVPQERKFLLFNPFLIQFTKSPNLVSTYMTAVNNISVVDFTDQNDASYIQFITYTLNVNRYFSREKVYHISMKVAASVSVEGCPLIKMVEVIDPEADPKETEEEPKMEYVFNDKYSLEENDLRVFLVIMDGTKQVCYIELHPTEIDEEASPVSFVYEADMVTDDHITSNGYLRILPGTIYRNKETGEYYKVYENDNTLYGKYDKDGTLIEADVLVDTVTELTNNGTLYLYQDVHNMQRNDEILIPLDNVECRIYSLYNRHFDEEGEGLILNDDSMTSNPFFSYDESLRRYIWTNEYTTGKEPVTFIKPLDSVRTYLSFEDFTEATKDEDGNVTFTHDIMDVDMKNIGFIQAATYFNQERMEYFMDAFHSNYLYLTDIIRNRLRNACNIDLKFYNTYGRSSNFLIGEEEDILDTVNLSLWFDIWFVDGTDTLIAIDELKSFIKEQVESINSNGMNNLFISNLMRKIEQRFAYVDHMKFKQINKYDSSYQAVRNYTTDLSTLSVEERRFYVPELLVCDEKDIHITDYYVS